MEPVFHFIESYFTEEKIESLFFIIIGSMALLFAGFLLFIIKYSFFKGMAIPLLIVGFIQLSDGISVYNRSAAYITRVNQFIKQEPQKLKTEELPRVEKVMKNFIIYKWVEISLMIGSIILFFAFYESPQTFWKGLALGLIIQTSIMLTLDIIAEKRGHIYIEKLNKSINFDFTSPPDK